MEQAARKAWVSMSLVGHHKHRWRNVRSWIRIAFLRSIDVGVRLDVAGD